MLHIEDKMQHFSTNGGSTDSRGLKEILSSLSRTLPGSHVIFVYPDIMTVRKIYSSYIKEQLDKNELVLFLPYYETVKSTKDVLSEFHDEQDQKIDVQKYIREGSLLIIDSHEAFFNHESTGDFTKESVVGSLHNLRNNDGGNIVSLMRMVQTHCRKLSKDGVTILVDLGSFFNIGGVDYLLKYEKSVPQIFKDMNLKQLCLYHQLDFDNRFGVSEKAKILDEHGRTLLMLNA